jgi:hypothetical protein
MSLAREVDMPGVVWGIFNAVYGLNKNGRRIEPDLRVLSVAHATCEELLRGDEVRKAFNLLCRFKHIHIKNENAKEQDENAAWILG